MKEIFRLSRVNKAMNNFTYDRSLFTKFTAYINQIDSTLLEKRMRLVCPLINRIEISRVRKFGYSSEAPPHLPFHKIPADVLT
eukprot:UN03932